MARNTRAKKQPEAHKIDGVEIYAALRELEKTQGIPMEYMLERLKQALTNAYRKDREDHRDVPAENVVVDVTEKGIFMYQVKTVVEELEDTALEIHIDTARNINPNAQVGDTVSIDDGPLAGFFGTVKELNDTSKKAQVSTTMFGRETVVEVEYVQITRVDAPMPEASEDAEG